MSIEDAPFLIVVGTDGSADARTAAEFALREAAAHQGSIRLVHAWTFPASAAGSELMGAHSVDDLRGAAQQVLDVEAAHLRRLAPDVDIEVELEYGFATTILLDHARGADMIVVGSRGVGRVMGLLLGSVSQAVVTRATCPVLVIPPATGKDS